MLRRLLERLRRPARPGVRPRRSGPTAPPVRHGQARVYDGPVRLLYEPDDDNGTPDPGEVVWAWVPYEDDPTQGKDRPVVVMGRALAGRRSDLVVLALSSKDHADDPGWLPLGVGAWDRSGRTSFVRVDRVLSVGPEGIRREGATLDRARFERVAEAASRQHGWA